VESLSTFLQDVSSTDIEQITNATQMYAIEDDIELSVVDMSHNRIYTTKKNEFLSLDNEQKEKFSTYGDNAWLKPFYSSYDGQQYIGYYEKFYFNDGVQGIIQKDINMKSLGERYSLSFYDGMGYSYVIDKEGNIIIRSQDKQSNRTLKNIYDVISLDSNSEDSVEQLQKAIEQHKNGVMEFDFDGQFFVFAVASIDRADDWCYISLIPETALKTHMDNIMQTSSLIVPLFMVGIVIMLILIYNKWLSQKENEKEQYIIKLNEKNNELKTLSNETFEAIAKAVDVNDRYTAGHSRRVAQYARMIAERMGYSDKELEEIYCAGLIHDVGKLGVDNSIINKQGKLSQEEYEEIKKHPIMGYEILNKISVQGNFAYGAKWHHERVDGKGYPDGLKGDEIPEIARIIAVADSYDAMTSKRSYRDVMPQAKVREQIENGMGTQFDEKIASIMLLLIDSDTEYKMRQTL
jgi:HD-GYP domain-containing protein (c-di-GMP phosphodiesterase class II)